MRLPLFTAFSFSDTFDKSGTAYFFRTGCVNLPESNLKKICFYVVHNLFRLFFFEIYRKMPIFRIDANRFVNMTICKIVLHEFGKNNLQGEHIMRPSANISDEKPYKIIMFYWLPVFIYCTAIFIQSSYPSVVHEPEVPHIDKLVHFLGYGLLGILFFRAFRISRFGKNADSLKVLSMVSAILYGISDEIHQYYVPSRSADIIDVLADTLGSIYGVFFYELITMRYYKKLSEWLALLRFHIR